MDTIEMNDFDRPEGGDEAEGGEDETVIDEDDFNDPLEQTVDELDEVKTSSFPKEHEKEKYERRKKQINKLYVIGKFNDIKGEFVRKLLRSEYRIDPTDGQNSREFISRLDITKYKLTFDGTEVGYIDTGGAYRMSGNKKFARSVRAFAKQYEKALVEHKKRARSVVEEETQGEASGANVEDIYEDAVEELHREVTVQGDDLVEQAKKLQDEGKISKQERSEFAGITAPKRLPKVKDVTKT
jgi:hypothetical protein